MLLKILKVNIAGLVFGLLFCLLYSYMNYILLLNNNYVNPYFILVIVMIFFFASFLWIMNKYCYYLSDEYESLVDNMAKLVGVLFLPLVATSMYMAFLGSIYYDIAHSNYEVIKTSKYIVRQLSNDASLNKDNIQSSALSQFSDVLDKERVDSQYFECEVQMPNDSMSYGANFVFTVYDNRNYDNLRYYTAAPLPNRMKWQFFYNFTNGQSSDDAVSKNDSLFENIKYSTPYIVDTYEKI